MGAMTIHVDNEGNRMAIKSALLPAAFLRDIIRTGLANSFGSMSSFEYNNEPKISLDFYSPTGIHMRITVERIKENVEETQSASQTLEPAF